jgi:tetratricopeptide (TPR) repeat protein
MKMDATIPDAHVYKGRYLLQMDSLNEAFNSFDKAIQIYESNNAPCYVMSICYRSRAKLNFAFGKIDNAIADFTKAIAKARDTKKDNLLMLRANAYLAKEDIKNAYQDIGAAFANKPDTLTLAFLHALKGETKKLEEILPFIIDKQSKLPKQNGAKLYNVACVYAIINNKEKALEYLEKSTQNGYDKFNWIQADYDMKNIKNLPEFNALIQKYKPAK